jgi:hypothetical protein
VVARVRQAEVILDYGLIMIGLRSCKKSPLNPRHILQVGRAAQRIGSPIQGDFEFYSRTVLGAGGKIYLKA